MFGLLIRHVRLSDLDAVEHLAMGSLSGMTSLPKNRDALKKRIQSAIDGKIDFFVLEDAGDVIGTCAIVPQVGIDQPFYTYDIQALHRKSKSLRKTVDLRVLNVRKTRHGPTEIGTLYLHPEHRQKGIGRFLSLSRFLYIALRPERYQETVIAEMRGVSDAEGRSPFWDHVGRHFFKMEFEQADLLTSMDKTFLEELLPKTPIYIDLLPSDAQEVIGKAHEHTQPALRMLEQEGFAMTHHVDLFDAGPQVSVRRKHIRTIKETRRARVSGTVDEESHSFLAMMTHGRHSDYRACVSAVEFHSDGVAISESAFALLKIKKGDMIFFSPFYEDRSFIRRFARWVRSVPILSK